MKPTYVHYTTLFTQSIAFYTNHIFIVLTLGIIAALARVGILNGFGTISTTSKIGLEIITELSRIMLFLAVLEKGNIVKGFQKLPHLVALFKGETWSVVGANIASH